MLRFITLLVRSVFSEISHGKKNDWWDRFSSNNLKGIYILGSSNDVLHRVKITLPGR